jgi:hypothetical protein
VEFKHLLGPWWVRWVPFDAKTSSKDLVKAACAYFASFSAPPLLLFAETDNVRPLQRQMACESTTINHLLSPRDGGRDGIPMSVMKACATQSVYTKLGRTWDCDSFDAMKRIENFSKVGGLGFQDMKALLIESTGGRITFANDRVPLKKPSKVAS